MSVSGATITTVATAAAGPIGGAVATIGETLGSLFGGGGPTKDTQVARFQTDQTSGNQQDAGALMDQAAYHGFIQTGITDKATWQAIFAGLYNTANPANQAYLLGLLRGGSLQYQFVGLKLDQTQIPDNLKAILASTATGTPTALPDGVGTTPAAQPTVPGGTQASILSAGSGSFGALLVIGIIVSLAFFAFKKGK